MGSPSWRSLRLCQNPLARDPPDGVPSLLKDAADSSSLSLPASHGAMVMLNKIVCSSESSPSFRPLGIVLALSALALSACEEIKGGLDSANQSLQDALGEFALVRGIRRHELGPHGQSPHDRRQVVVVDASPGKGRQPRGIPSGSRPLLSPLMLSADSGTFWRPAS